MFSRRFLLGSLVSAPLLVGPAIFVADAEAQRRCRVNRFPTVRRCLEDCGGAWPTLECQIGALFPTPERVGQGSLVGAILGGVVAWAVGGDAEAVLAGFALGGAIGGATRAADQYRGYQLARAANDPNIALRNVVADRADDGERIALLRSQDALNEQMARIADAPRIIEVNRPSELRELQGAIVAADFIVGATGASVNNSKTSLDVLDDTASYVARRAGSAEAPPMESVRDQVRTTEEMTRDLAQRLQQLASHPRLRMTQGG